MHKFFAKTLFLGKNIEFLTECHSTNDEMLQRAKFGGLKEGSIIWTDYQVRGKGQRGNTWESEKGTNLLFSLYLKPSFLKISDQHYITFIAALSIYDLMEELGIRDEQVKIKWPNDVFLGDKKMAGILTEASIYQGILDSAVLGVGLNVNQKEFKNPYATSISITAGRDFDRIQLLEDFTLRLEKYYLILKAGNLKGIRTQYESILYKKGVPHQFFSKKEFFEGEIVGIDEKGWLQVKTKSGTKTFNFREIQFLR